MSANNKDGSESGHTPEIGPDGQPIFPLEDANDNVAGVPPIDAIEVSEEKPPLGPDGYPVTSSYDKFAEPGRVRRFATISNMLNSLLGAGILSVPASLKHCGIVVSTLLLLVIAAFSHIGTVLTIKLQARTEASGLDDLALQITGKYGSIALSILSMLFCMSCMIGYLIIGGDMLLSWFRLAHFKIEGTLPRALLILIYACVLPVALTIPKEMRILSYFSTATVFFIGFFFLAIIIKSCIELPKHGSAKGIVIAKFGMGFFSALSIYGLAFALPVVVLPIITPYNKDLRKRSIVSLVTVLLCFIFVIVPGILGYVMLGNDIKDNILNTYPDNDVLIILVRIGFFCVVSFSYPCLGTSEISSWAQLVFHKNNQNDLTKKQRIIILIIANIIPVLVAMFLPTASPAISVAGALGGCAVDFFYPPFMWFLISKKRWFHWQNILCLLFAVFGIGTAVICTYQAVIDAINSFK